MSLKQQAITGTKWASAAQVGRQVLQVLTLVVLARLLSPADFGLMSMVVVVTGFGLLFSDLGTVSAIIQRQAVSENLLSSVFWFNLLIGSAMTLLVFFSAPLVAWLYQEPRIIPMLHVLSLLFVVSSLGAVQKALLQRNLHFRWLAIAEMLGAVAGAVLAMGMALAGLGVWSLVGQTLINIALLSLLYWRGVSWYPRRLLHWREIWSISGFSLNLSGVIVANYVIRNADYVLIGRFLGSQSLGYYTIAYRIMLMPLQNITYVIGRVLFPMLAQIQDDNSRIARAYLRVVGSIAIVTFPLMTGVMVLAEPFVLAVFGPQWQPVVVLLVILAPVGLMQSIGATAGTLYKSKGRTDIQLRWAVATGIITVLAFLLGLQWGVVGIATAYAVVVTLLLYPQFYIPLRLIDQHPRILVPVLWRPLLSSLLMLLVLLGLQWLLPPMLAPLWVLLIAVPAGASVYILASWFINRTLLWELVTALGLQRRLLRT